MEFWWCSEGRAPVFKTQPKYNPQSERNRAKMGAGEGKNAKFWAPPPFEPPPLRAPVFGVPTLWALTFGPQNSGHHISDRGPPGPHFFWVWPLRSSFFHISFFCAFLIVSISCHFFCFFHCFCFCFKLVWGLGGDRGNPPPPFPKKPTNRCRRQHDSLPDSPPAAPWPNGGYGRTCP